MIEVDRVTKKFGEGASAFTALDNVSVTINSNEFFTLLGPSGCGKTTLLRVIAGFLDPTSGAVALDGEDILPKAPYERPVNTVFQSYALFPHLTVAQNIAFGLEMLERPKAEIKSTVDEMLALVRMEPMADRRTSEISGGQQQRVALARALAPRPKVLLLDEPLSALDFKLRKEMQIELKRLQTETGITFVFVTHDQEEALTMSDRIAVMNAGRIEQVGRGEEIYSAPRTAFAASFVGEANTIHGRVTDAQGDSARIETAHGSFVGRNPTGLSAGDAAILFVRPEAMQLEGGENDLNATLQRRDLEGPFVTLHMTSDSGLPVAMHLPNTGTGALSLAEGSAARIGFATGAATILPEGPLARTGREEIAAQ